MITRRFIFFSSGTLKLPILYFSNGRITKQKPSQGINSGFLASKGA
jgi:hypothetical protein